MNSMRSNESCAIFHFGYAHARPQENRVFVYAVPNKRQPFTEGVAMKLTEAMKALVREQRLGFVASVNADGTPNLSPKGTFEVLDDKHLGFLDIRSPNTARNIRNGSKVEINFIDPFVRKGFRFFGPAEILLPSSDEARALVAKMSNWQRRAETHRGVVKIRVERAAPLISPAYDDGTTEESLRRSWTETFRRLQPGGRFAE